MKTVLIILPGPPQPASNGRELIEHFVADVRGLCAARKSHVAQLIASHAVCPDQFWTWFLPNPLPSPNEKKTL